MRDPRPQVVLAFRTQHGVLGGLEHHRPDLDFTLANARSHSYSAGPSHRAGDRQPVPLVAGMLDVDFDIESPPELARHLRKLSDRFTSAAVQR
ncbi:hypothetical protein B1L11_09040 [Microbispora sp. GKU 823]|nr:hypothetical protein B1L11_09040 [Microbispora sp. GKU 823]